MTFKSQLDNNIDIFQSCSSKTTVFLMISQKMLETFYKYLKTILAM